MKKRAALFPWAIVPLLMGTYIFTPIPVQTETKHIHISFDDVSQCFQEMTADTAKYTSLTDHPFFDKLQTLHDEFGCSFSLYCYYRLDTFELSNMSDRFRSDFKKRAEWLKLGFHAIQPGFDAERDGNSDSLQMYFLKTKQAVSEFADSSCITKTLRLNRFYATPKQLQVLESYGVKCLLGADDERISYSLSQDSNNKLISYGRVRENNLTILHTDIRLENVWLPESAILSHKCQDTLVIFTHERDFNVIGYWKLRRFLVLTKDNNINYLN